MTIMNATNPITALPPLPETAPFTPAQRAWLNGFFAALVGSGEHNVVTEVTTPASTPTSAAPAEAFPWHDPSLSIDQRLDLAKEKPVERKLMAAMAQLDCGSCGYLCQTYAEAIAKGEEKNLTLCSPGGKDTAKKLKELVQLGVKDSVTDRKPESVIGHPQSAIFSRSNPYPSRLLSCTPLNKPGSDKDTRHIVFDLKSSGLHYKPGDALGIYPENCPDLVHEILELLRASGAEDVTTPAGEPASLYEALLRHCSITTPTDELLRLLRHDPAEGFSVLDLLKRHTGPMPPADQFAAALAPLNPRLYSISSSPLAHVDQVHLTVGVVRYRNGAGTPCKGVCSTYLADRLRPGAKARVFFQPSHRFSLPESGDTPIIMIGPGTGVAPFRAFLQHRQATAARGQNWLFFGDQRRATDFLYEQELLAWHNDGLLTQLTTAFSRDQSGKVYVQHRMLEHQADLWRWLEQGAHVYVCGDAKKMAHDVDAALKQIIQQQGGKTAEQSIAYVAELGSAGRYQRDVY
jgi:sulfite reductase (NADPH) flavoprotein alpha-component